jgi:hypothetical protein
LAGFFLVGTFSEPLATRRNAVPVFSIGYEGVASAPCNTGATSYGWLTRQGTAEIMTTIAQAKARYAAAADAARRYAALGLRRPLGLDFHIGQWSQKAAQAYAQQWEPLERHPDGGWDWPEVFWRHNREPDRFEMVIWGPGDRLCGLSLASTSSSAVTIKFLEGDPRPDCPASATRLGST